MGLSLLPDIEPFDLSIRPELESKIRNEVSPLVGMKMAYQVKAMAFDAIDRRKPFVTECFSGERGEAPRCAVVKKLRIG